MCLRIQPRTRMIPIWFLFCIEYCTAQVLVPFLTYDIGIEVMSIQDVHLHAYMYISIYIGYYTRVFVCYYTRLKP